MDRVGLCGRLDLEADRLSLIDAELGGEALEARVAGADADVQAVRTAGYSDAQILEIVLHVALNTLTNYVNVVADTDIDFPVLEIGKAA